MTRHAERLALAAEGLTATEIAARCGVAICTISRWAKSHGVTLADGRKSAAHAERMRKLHADPEFAAAHAERMRKLHADPEFAAAHAERMRKLNADPDYNPLAALTPAERADYDTLKIKGRMTRVEALAAIGRADLIRGGAA